MNHVCFRYTFILVFYQEILIYDMMFQENTLYLQQEKEMPL